MSLADEMHEETARVKAMIELNNDIAMAMHAFNEGKETIAGDMRQKILDCMLENECGHITQRQLFGLMN